MFRRRPSHFSLWFGEINIIYYYYDIKNVMFSANIEIHFNLYISNSILDFLHDLFLSLNMMNKYFRDLGDELDSEILYSSHIANSDNHLSDLGTSLKTLKILGRLSQSKCLNLEQIYSIAPSQSGDLLKCKTVVHMQCGYLALDEVIL